VTLGPDAIQRSLFDVYRGLNHVLADPRLLAPHELRILRERTVKVIVATSEELNRRARPRLLGPTMVPVDHNRVSRDLLDPSKTAEILAL
jgi:hypothetical protein